MVLLLILKGLSMKTLLLPVDIAAVAMSAPANAVVKVSSQVAIMSLGNLDVAAINAALVNFADFNSFALAGQQLTQGDPVGHVEHQWRCAGHEHYRRFPRCDRQSHS
jgi:hypothetical protein